MYGIAAILLLVLVALQGCGGIKPQLRSDHDPRADFSTFRKYRFMPVPASVRLGQSGPVGPQMIAAIRQAMEARGYIFDPDDPDLLVDFSVSIKRTSHTASSPESFYSYRTGHYRTWPGYSSELDEDTERHVVQAINVDLVDSRSRRLVWEGVEIGEIHTRGSKDRRHAIENGVKRIFDLYPFRAGGDARDKGV